MDFDVFISYHTKSSLHITEAVCNALENKKIKCWYAPRNIAGNYAKSIVEAIGRCKIFLLILNREASYSEDVLNEINLAVERVRKGEDISIIPFHISEDEISLDAKYYLSRMHWVDAINPPLEKRIQELVSRISYILNQNTDTNFEESKEEPSLKSTYSASIGNLIGRKDELKILEENLKKPTKGEKKIEYTGKTKVEDEIINVKALFNSYIDSEGKIAQKEIQNLRNRIENLENKITELSTTEVYKVIDKLKLALVKSPLKKTNLMLKNVNFQYAVNLWDYIQENIEDQTKEIASNKEYEDTGRIKKLYDESFMLEYLGSKLLDKDEIEEEEEVKEIKDEMLERLIERILNLAENMTEDQLKKTIGERFVKVKYKKNATIQEIQNIFKKYIDKYIEKVRE